MTGEELTDIVRELEPVIRANADAGERERRVPKETADALRATGLFRTWLPRSHGGWEVEPLDAFRVFEALARIDGSAAWLVQMCSTASLTCAWLGDEGVADVLGSESPVIGISFAPPMRLTRAAGGWRASGQASFASNCHHADWFFFSAPGEGEQMLAFAVPRGEFEVVDHWDVVGMRGTGSHDVRVDGAFVPARRAAVFEPLAEARSRAYRMPLARMGSIWLGVTSLGVLALGIAGAALDDFVGLCAAKTPNYSPAKLGESALTHYRLGEAHATLGAARAYLYATVGDVWARVSAGTPLAARDRCDLAAAATWAVASAGRCIDVIGESAGTSLVRDESPLSRRARDVRTLTQHVFTSRNRFQEVGALRLERPPAFAMLGF